MGNNLFCVFIVVITKSVLWGFESSGTARGREVEKLVATWSSCSDERTNKVTSLPVGRYIFSKTSE